MSLVGLAYYNHGRWVCDCPFPGCKDARSVYHLKTGERLTEDVCAAGHAFRIEMPPQHLEAQIAAELAKRPEPADQGWFPAGHARAALAGFPTGQSVEELREETRHVEQLRARAATERKDRLRALLAEHGIEVRPDGTVAGSL